jgi:hypothetical protein
MLIAKFDMSVQQQAAKAVTEGVKLKGLFSGGKK